MEGNWASSSRRFQSPAKASRVGTPAGSVNAGEAMAQTGAIGRAKQARMATSKLVRACLKIARGAATREVFPFLGGARFRRALTRNHNILGSTESRPTDAARLVRHLVGHNFSDGWSLVDGGRVFEQTAPLGISRQALRFIINRQFNKCRQLISVFSRRARFPPKFGPWFHGSATRQKQKSPPNNRQKSRT